MKTLCIILTLVLTTFAAHAVPQRYRVQVFPTGSIPNAGLAADVATFSTAQVPIALRLDFQRFNVNAVVVRLEDDEKTTLEAARPQYVVRLDRPVRTNAPPSPSWAPTDLAGSLTAPADYDCCGEPPHIYLVDTGVRSSHEMFTTVTPAGLQPTFVANALSSGTSPSGTIADAYVDYGDHGTRMAGALAGSGTGLLTQLGLPATIVSVNAYDAGSVFSTFASQCELEIYNSLVDHLDRIAATPYLRNHGSVLLFPHGSVPAVGRIGSLDYAVQTAWANGMTVVVSAGNDSNNAAAVSPAGADWAQSNGATVIPYFDGAVLPGFNLQRANSGVSRLLVAGAHDQGVAGGAAMWANSNRNTLSAGAAVDLLAPGVGLVVPAGTGDLIYHSSAAGTSYSAAFTAAAAAWVQTLRPWASPAQVRAQILASSATTISAGGVNYSKLALPSVAALSAVTMSYDDWAAHYLVAPLRAGDADPDSDGIKNQIEYYCGLDPRFPDSSSGPTITFNATLGTMTVTMPTACYLPAAPTVTWTIESTATLGTPWTTVALGVLTQTTPCVAVGDGTQHSLTQAVAFGTQAFYRFRFVKTP